MNEPTQPAPATKEELLSAINARLLLQNVSGISAVEIMQTVKPFIADFCRESEARAVAEANSKANVDCLAWSEKYSTVVKDRDALRGQVTALREAIPYPGLTAGAAEAIAFEIECGKEAKSTIPPEAKSKWLRYLASKLRAFEIAAAESVPTIPDPSDTLDSRGVAEDERNPRPARREGEDAMSVLLPCPFCGENPIVDCTENHSEGGGPDSWLVCCGTSFCYGNAFTLDNSFHTRAHACEAWNSRRLAALPVNEDTP